MGAAAAIGSGISLIGSFMQADAQEDAANTKAQFAGVQAQQQAQQTELSANIQQGTVYASKYNAKVAGQQAVQSRDAAAQEATAYRIQAGQQLGTIRASYAANGVGMSGSALDVLAVSAMNAELNALTIVHKGEIQAEGYESQARLDDFTAMNAQYQVDAARANAAYQISLIGPTQAAIRSAGEAQALGTIISGVAKFAGGMPTGGLFGDIGGTLASLKV